MRVFLHAQQRGLRLHPDLAQFIRNQLALADRAFLHDEHVRETFLAILNQRGNVAPILRADARGRACSANTFPSSASSPALCSTNFITNTPRTNTRWCASKNWTASGRPARSRTPVTRRCSRASNGRSCFISRCCCTTSAKRTATAITRRSAASSRSASPNASASTAPPRTPCGSSSKIICSWPAPRSGATSRTPPSSAPLPSRCKTPRRSTLLTLHTFADSLATSDKLWNGFKDSLLWTLHLKAMPLLTGGTEFVRAEEKQRELLAEEVHRSLPGNVSEEELHAHFGTLPPRYFQIHSAPEIVRDLVLVHRFLHLQLAEEDRTRWSRSWTGTTSPTAATPSSKSAPGTAPGCSATSPAPSAPPA